MNEWISGFRIYIVSNSVSAKHAGV
jgi:hypothetical protein